MRVSFTGKNVQGKTPFTRELWVKWHQARRPTAQTFKLRAGIREMRALLSQAEGSRASTS